MTRRRKNARVPRAKVSMAPVDLGKGPGMDAVSRALDVVTRAVSDGTAGYLGQAASPIDVDLVIGDNQIRHGLGRTPLGVIAIPFDAGASLPGWDPAQVGNPHPARLAVVTSLATGRYRLIFF